MNLNFQIATQWDELNEYQFRNIAYLLLNKENYVKADDFKKKVVVLFVCSRADCSKLFKISKMHKKCPNARTSSIYEFH